MSQDNMIIGAGLTGVEFREEITSNLQALASCSSGPTAPTVTYAYQLWADTTAKMMKQRNATNSYWKSLWSLSDAVVKKHITTAVSPYTAPSTILFITVYCTTGNITINLPSGSSLATDQRIIIKRIDAESYTVTLNTYDPGGGMADIFFEGGTTKNVAIESTIELVPGEDATIWYTL